MVDDKPADGETVRRHLTDESIPWRIDLDVCLSLDEALSAVQSKTFDLLIVDYQFPFGNGFDVLDRIRHEGFDQPAVMLTGQGSEDVAAQAVKHKLHDYIPKSDLSPATLRESLESILSEPNFNYRSARSSEKNLNAPENVVTVEPVHQLLSQLSTHSQSRETLRLFTLNFVARTASLDLPPPGRLLTEFFRELLLEPLSFFRIHSMTFLALPDKPLEELLTLEEPVNNLPRLLVEGVSPSKNDGSQNVPLDCRMLMARANTIVDDPANILNDCLDRIFSIPPESIRGIQRTVLD